MKVTQHSLFRIAAFPLMMMVVVVVVLVIPNGVQSFQRLGLPACRTFGCARISVSVSGKAPEAAPSADKDGDGDVDGNYGRLHSLPWSELQDYALRDNLPKYVVSIPKKGSRSPGIYALWRTMTREIIELSGYPVEMLMDMHAKQLRSSELDKSKVPTTPGVLPLLDEYEFESSGGLSGRAYGIPGLAEGTKIETSIVADVQLTLPRGFVQTQDGSVAYELGIPVRDFYSLGGNSGRSQALVNSARDAVGAVAMGSLKESQNAEDGMLIRLGATTAILLAGATAVNMLSHHLTVNVFWV